MHQSAEAGVGHGGKAAPARGKSDGLLRTQHHAGLAALATVRIDAPAAVRNLGNGVEAAVRLTDAAAVAGGRIDAGQVAREEVLPDGILGIEEDVHIRRIHVEVAEDRILGQGRKGGRQGRLAGAALAA